MKRKILSVVLFLVVILGCGAVLFAIWVPEGEPVVELVPLTEESEAEYLVRTENDQVCVYQNGTLICTTGIRVAALPQGDRALLEEGISARDSAEVSALLEDLGA